MTATTKPKVFNLSSIVACDEGSSYVKVARFAKGKDGLEIKTSRTISDVSPGVLTTSDGFGDGMGGPMLTAVSVNGDSFSHGMGNPDGDSRLEREYQTSHRIVAATQFALFEAGFAGQHVNLSTGVPIQQFYGANGAPDEQLINKKIELFTTASIHNKNGSDGILSDVDEELLVTIDSNRVFPEAIGAYYDMVITTNGQINDNFKPEGDVLVIDLGSNTCDIAIVTEKRKILQEYNKSFNDQGFYKIFDSIRSGIGGRYRNLDMENFSIKRLEACLLTKELKTTSGNLDVAEEVDQALKRHINSLTTKIKQVLRSKMDTLDKIILVGAGAESLKPYFSEMQNAIYVPEEPGFSNVKGFLKLLAYNPPKKDGAPAYIVEDDL